MSAALEHPGQLTTGWEADLPPGDSILRRFLACWSSVCETFAGAAGGMALRTPDFAAADYGRPSGWFNSATLLAPPGGSVCPGGRTLDGSFAAVLDEIEAFFAPGYGEALLLSAWPTPDLTPRGWRLVGHPPLLIRPPARLVAPPPEPAAAGIVEVTDPAGLVEWEEVAAEGYPLPELVPVRPGTIADARLLADPRLSFTVGRRAGRAVSLGALFVEAGVGCFTLGVTRPSARRLGHWQAHAVHRLLTAPDVWMTGIFSDHSRPLAERLGFVPLFRLTLWARDRPGRDPAAAAPDRKEER